MLIVSLILKHSQESPTVVGIPILLQKLLSNCSPLVLEQITTVCQSDNFKCTNVSSEHITRSQMVTLHSHGQTISNIPKLVLIDVYVCFLLLHTIGLLLSVRMNLERDLRSFRSDM
jgi:hypothetical protein